MQFLFTALLLSVALSIDAFVAAVSYGSQKIHIPKRSLLVIAFFCSAFLGLSLHIGAWLGGFLDYGITAYISFTILFALGLFRIFDSLLKRWILKQGKTGKEISFSVFRLRFILQIYADPKKADVDGSRILSLGEASFLAVALSLDGLAAGLGAGLAGAGAWLTIGLTFLLTLFAMAGGCRFGTRLARVISTDISWIAGGLLILLAILQL